MMIRTGILAVVMAGVFALPALAKHDADATAELINNAGERIGQVDIHEGSGGTLLRLELQGLPPGPKAIHIHGTGTCDDHDHGFTDSGGHLNPGERKHGLLNRKGPDAGDLTNFYVHENGYAWAEIFTALASLDGSVGAKILDDDGAAIVIHENPDDHKSQPIGGAGARIACGVIRANN